MKTSKLFWGFIFLGCGVLLLLNTLGLGGQYPAVRIVGSCLLLAISVASLSKFRFVLFFIPLALIAFIWRTEIGIAAISAWPLIGAAALLGIGLSVIFHKKPICAISSIKKGDSFGQTEETLNEEEQAVIQASWGDHIKYVHATNLKKAQINSSFAQTRVYFDQCQISPEGLEININVSFSETILVVPKSWRIDSRINIFAAALTNLAPIPAGEKANVKLAGSVNFAELKIEYV